MSRTVTDVNPDTDGQPTTDNRRRTSAKSEWWDADFGRHEPAPRNTSQSGSRPAV